MRRRRSISPIKAIIAIIGILFILGAGAFAALLFIPGFSTTMTSITGVNFTQETNKISSSLGLNMTKPIGVTVETNNATLAKDIMTVNGPYSPSELQSHALILQPNVTYVFNITIVPVNSVLQTINVPWNTQVNVVDYVFVNGKTPSFGGVFATFENGTQSIKGTTPINTTLIIKMPPDTNDTIMIYSPSGANAQTALIFAETPS